MKKDPERKAWNAADDKCLLLLTSRSAKEMIQQGGSQSWVLNLQRARECRYVVCAWNPRGEHARPTVNLRHGEAYLAAPIAAIEPAKHPEPPGRYIVRFSASAVPPGRKIVWTGKRNPVNYTTLSALKLNADDLVFASKDVPAVALDAQVAADQSRGAPVENDAPLTISAAKRGLAQQFGVDPESIEIVIRG